MAKTKASAVKKGRANYGKNYQRGTAAELKAAKSLRGGGWSVMVSPGSRGKADLVCTKGREVKKVQVKAFASRTFKTASAAGRRARSHPHNARVPYRGELWIYDAAGTRHIVRGGDR